MPDADEKKWVSKLFEFFKRLSRNFYGNNTFVAIQTSSINFGVS